MSASAAASVIPALSPRPCNDDAMLILSASWRVPGYVSLRQGCSSCPYGILNSRSVSTITMLRRNVRPSAEKAPFGSTSLFRTSPMSAPLEASPPIQPAALAAAIGWLADGARSAVRSQDVLEQLCLRL